MENVKGALQSRAVWLGIFGFLIPILKIVGVDLGVDPAWLTDQVVMLITALTSLGAVFFRIMATAKISGLFAPKQ